MDLLGDIIMGAATMGLALGCLLILRSTAESGLSRLPHGVLMLGACVILPVWPAGAQEFPARKAGLWEISFVFESRNPVLRAELPPIVRQCIDAETDGQMHPLSMGKAKLTCSKWDVRNSSGKIIVDSVCKSGAETTTTHAEITGDFDSAFVAKLNSKSEEGAEENMTIEAIWKGSCPTGLKPGELITATGRKVHIREQPPSRTAPPIR